MSGRSIATAVVILAGMSHTPPESPELARAFAAYAARQTFDRAPATLYDPVRYVMGVAGKRVRPLLLLQAHALGGDSPDRALPAAYAVELFHNFTLVHDDIMDAADTRRGRPSVHAAFGQDAAILSGDVMLIDSYGYLLNHYDSSLATALARRFGTMAAELCGGQQRDMDMERAAGGSQSYAAYLEMIGGKTGVLITACLELGALIAELPEASVDALKRAGTAAGRAFQIMDDVLDTFSTGSATGKMDYGDVQRGKQSAPFLRALDVADERQRGRLVELYALTPEARRPHIPEVLELYGRLGVQDVLRAEVAALTEEAVAALRSVDGVAGAKQALTSSILALAGRAS